MIGIGNFFFRYRNLLFIVLYILLFIPSPQLFSEEVFGAQYWVFPFILGLFITITGQAIRGATIGLAYIIRGGRDKKVYAEELVTQGIFSHCRNPLYVGNILMLLGVGVLANSMLYVLIVMPLFLFIYQAIVLAEENFLRGKFGTAFNEYCKRVNRWIPSLNGIGKTFQAMQFNYRRWMLKEYNTQFVWIAGILLIIFTRYPQVTGSSEDRWYVFGALILLAGIYYGTVRYLKKSGKMKE
ncbi:MAG TPA: isoprenylcysteine carboxylmethyltransferase family protein [Chitinophagaceae bacterium]|nr:isoprenylcysteine carboxylmethyltransferase family protein [Chitinophagaceae bacterium]